MTGQKFLRFCAPFKSSPSDIIAAWMERAAQRQAQLTLLLSVDKLNPNEGFFTAKMTLILKISSDGNLINLGLPHQDS